MTKVQFHILPHTRAPLAWQYVCGLVEKLYDEQPESIYLHTDSKADAERLNDLLWTYRDDGFLPHQLYQPNATDTPPRIQIGFAENPGLNGTLINLSQQVPSFYCDFKQIIEIVFTDPVVQQLGRERFRFYRTQGCDINTRKL
ncbi:MAG TPA: DNA polymerase III subunit chi [Gammaproteobacteria bacterium]|jgi:DNA polymerase-3 subunit chi|nr:DNA polymerase III subunit chi [Gammaproteobacteria bacterium]